MPIAKPVQRGLSRTRLPLKRKFLRSRFLHRLFTFKAGSGFGNVRALPARSKRLDTRPLIRVDRPILIFGGPYSNLAATAAVLAEAKRLWVGRVRVKIEYDYLRLNSQTFTAPAEVSSPATLSPPATQKFRW